jgi:hypothetical protein
MIFLPFSFFGEWQSVGAGADIFTGMPGSSGTTTAYTFNIHGGGSGNGFAGQVTDGLNFVS